MGIRIAKLFPHLAIRVCTRHLVSNVDTMSILKCCIRGQYSLNPTGSVARSDGGSPLSWYYIVIMVRSLVLRFGSALLAAFFVCGGFVLPDIDAVLFHGVSSQQESRPHVESKGYAGCHAESCVLGTVSTQGPASGCRSPGFARPLPPVTAGFVSQVFIPSNAPSGLCGSRAPPVALLS